MRAGYYAEIPDWDEKIDALMFPFLHCLGQPGYQPHVPLTRPEDYQRWQPNIKPTTQRAAQQTKTLNNLRKTTTVLSQNKSTDNFLLQLWNVEDDGNCFWRHYYYLFLIFY